jgi:hypothetical protein
MTGPRRDAVTVDTTTAHRAIRWELPGAEADCRDNFFLGLWQPRGSLSCDLLAPAAREVASLRGENWLLASAQSVLHRPARSLVHASAEGAIAFRGYLLEPPLHSYSDSAAIVDYWRSRAQSQHNGIFSAASVDARTGALALFTDFFGMSPLYWRQLDSGIAFSTNPRYLSCATDAPDLIAWRELLEIGFISSDRSLTTEIHRVPAGHYLRADAGGTSVQPWFQFDRLPAGERPVDGRSAAQVEAAFRTAMQRCARLAGLRTILPLSSGHDSRRILTALLADRVPFDAMTARVFQKEHRDLDAPYAAEMARDFGLSHRIVEPAPPEQFAADDARRSACVDAETMMHTWALRLFDALPQEPCLLYDGILGDILGNPGFRLPDLYRSPAEDIEVILRACFAETFDGQLNRSRWPEQEALRDDVRGYLRQWLPRPNLAEFAFILLRQRRMTALWSQQLLPPGHVVVCPFVDLDYVRLLLDFIPADKHRTVFQRRCLEEFWPQFARYPGNRDIPSTLPPGSPQLDHAQMVASRKRHSAALRRSGMSTDLTGLLTWRGRIELYAGELSDALFLRAAWYTSPLTEMVLRRAVSCLRVAPV